MLSFRRSFLRGTFLVLVALLILVEAHAQVAPIATTTTLAVSPSASVVSGTLVTLTATVADASGPVLHGTVTFYDGTRILANVQLVSTNSAGFTPGTATLKTLSLAVGTHSITAKFSGTNADLASASTAQSVTVSGPAPTISTLAWTGSSIGNNSLTASVSGTGSNTPTGSVAFTEITTGASLGTANLVPAPLNQFLIGPGLPQPAQFDQNLYPVVGDVNHDGIDDLIEEAGFGKYYVYVLLGRGDGTFQSPLVNTITAYGLEGPLQLGDFNGDGNLDLVATGASFGSGVEVLLGNGDGTFQPPIPSNETGAGGFATVLVSDFNGDGILDVGYLENNQVFDQTCFCVVTTSDLRILNGKGDGTFSAGSVSTFPQSISSLGYATVTQGLLVVTGSWGIQAGNASAAETGTQTLISQDPAASVTVGDMNGDGYPDIVAVTDGLSVFINDGQGNFSLKNSVPLPGSINPFNIPDLTKLVDFNRDGQLDAVFTDTNGNVDIYFGNGDGTLSPTPLLAPNVVVQPPDSQSVPSVFAGNLRGFGLTDLLVTNGTNFNLLTGTNLSATASLENLTLPPTGIQQLGSEYQGDSTFAPSASNIITLASPLQPTVHLINEDGEVPQGQLASFQVLVTGPGGITPTGFVQFYDNGNALGSSIALANGSATYSTTTLAIGTHTITVSYPGDPNYQPATSNAVSVSVLGLVKFVLSYSGPTTITSGSPISLPFQLSPVTTGLPAPTGSISISTQPSNSPPVTIGSVGLSGNPPFTLNIPVNTASQPLPIGQQFIEGLYSGDQNWSAAGAGATFLVQGQVSLSLSSNLASPFNSGTPVVLSGVVTQQTPYTSAPYGYITLLESGKAVPNVLRAIVGNNGSSYSFQVNTANSPLAVGTHSFTVSYGGAVNWAAATSAPLNVTVKPTASIALTAANVPMNGSAFPGATLKFLATIGDIGNGPIPTGTVQFSDGSTALGAPVPVLQGVATLSSSQFALGAHSVTAAYSGDSNYAGVTSTVFTFKVISQLSNTLLLNLGSASPVASGSAFSITAAMHYGTVPGAPQSTGTISLIEDGKTVATQPITGNMAVFSVNTSANPLSAGSHTFSASYTGDTVYLPSTSSTAMLTVTGNLPTFKLTSDVGSFSNVVQGTPLAFTATVGAVSGLPTPTGTVQFFVDTVIAGSPVTLTNGVATYTSSSLGVGTHAITAAYSGNASYNSTTTNATAAIVTQGTDAIALSLSGPSTVGLGTPITLKGSLSVASLGPAPTGTVTLLDGAAAIGTATLSGSAPISLNFTVNTPGQPLTAGSHTFSLNYGGAAQWTGSTSSAQAVTIGKSESVASVVSSGLTVLAGTSVTFTTSVSATVTSPVPTGTVQFYDGTTMLGTPVTLAAGKAIYTTSALTAGSHSISSTYSGDANFAASTSSAITEAVQDVAPQIGASTVTTAPGSSATETLTITALGGLNETTSFQCSGLPQGANCTFAPTSVTGSGTTTLTITTTGPTATLTPRGGWLAGGGAALACVVLLGWPKRRRNWMQMLGVLLLIVSLSATGCGGGSSSSSGSGGTPPASNATPAGNYTITVTTTTGSGAAAIVQHLTFQLTVT